MIPTAAILFLAVVFVRKLSMIDGRKSPDCQFYLEMSGGGLVPEPYCHRPVVPWLARLASKLSGISTPKTMRFLSIAGLFLAVCAIYLTARHIGASEISALSVAVVYLGTDSAVGVMMLFPWLVDGLAVALGLGSLAAFSSGIPVLGCLLLALATLTKEAIAAISAVFLAVSGIASVLWLALAALPYLAFRCFVRGAAPSTEWLRHKFIEPQKHKRKLWFDYQRNLGALKAVPLASCWFLPDSSLGLACLAASAVAWLETNVAMDHARVLAFALPFVLVSLALSIPDNVAVCLALVTLWWPLPVSIEDCI